ncbi:unnamed protein product [Caenorhabditis auriculariae]|uniref:Uncharacterized protein n=1 Tax=Caenorhabditis auriculariae TaxID=2777116 RepID=A0A8S1HAL1_9PELO|nr:unnamed protein product [Caenorhabditis auriculariae]
MSDNKVNMSLDDIISLNKKKRPAKTNGAKPGFKHGLSGRGGGARRGRGKATVAGNNRGALRSAALLKKKALKRVGGPANTVQPGVNQATKKLVQQLVNKALRNTRTAPNVRPRVIRRRGGLAASNVGLRANALNRILPRSKTIVRREIVPVTRRVPIRARPAFREVEYEEEPEEEYIEEVAGPSRRLITQVPRTRVAQPVRQPVVIQRVIQRAPRQQQQIIRRQVPVQQVIQRVQRQPQRAGRVVQWSSAQRGFPARRGNNNRQFVEVTRKNDRFREAMGLSGPRRQTRVVHEVQRFEPVYATERITRRGRGFIDYQ